MDIDLGVAAFWISVAAVVIGGYWANARKEATKHNTLLRLVERTGQINEEQIKLLFPQPAPPPSGRPGDSYHNGRIAMKVIGSILLSIAAGLLILFTILAKYSGGAMPAEGFFAFGIVGLITCIGGGFFVGARFIYPARTPGDGETR